MINKILILGGSGLVGNAVIKKTADSYRVTATYNTKNVNTKKCKLIKLVIKNDKKVLRTIIHDESPDIVINTIAYANVDFCETNKEDAHFLHVDCVKEVVEACTDIGAKLIHISTDWIFDGKKNIYSENDTPNPINYYGITRLLAEKSVLEKSQNIILRPALIYGWHPNSRFLNFVIDNLKSGKEVFAFTDQYATPTFVDDLAECILRMIESNVNGVYHTVGSGCINRFEFARLVAEKFDLDIKLVKPVTTSERPQIAKRPTISCLDNTKASKRLNLHFSTINEGLTKVLEQSRMN